MKAWISSRLFWFAVLASSHLSATEERATKSFVNDHLAPVKAVADGQSPEGVYERAESRLGSSIDDFRPFWAPPSAEENLGRTSNLKWNRLPNGESIVPGIFALEAAFLDGIACEVTLRSKQRIMPNKLRQLTKPFLTAFRDADFAKARLDLNGFLTYDLSDGTFVSVNEHAGHRVIVITGLSYIRNESVFDREAAKVRPPTSNH